MQAKSTTLARKKPTTPKVTELDNWQDMDHWQQQDAVKALRKQRQQKWDRETRNAFRWFQDRGLKKADAIKAYKGKQRGYLLQRWNELSR